MEFIFDNTTASILPFLQQTTQFIRQELSLEGVSRELLLNHCKFIITEFCTNGIKHCGQNKTVFNIYADNDTLVINKTDTGAPFKVTWQEQILAFPLPAHIDTIVITEDDINCLCMKRLTANSVTFYTRQNTIDKNSPPFVNEHFGFIIISLSATRFTYTRDEVSHSNVFTATINLQS